MLRQYCYKNDIEARKKIRKTKKNREKVCNLTENK